MPYLAVPAVLEMPLLAGAGAPAQPHQSRALVKQCLIVVSGLVLTAAVVAASVSSAATEPPVPSVASRDHVAPHVTAHAPHPPDVEHGHERKRNWLIAQSPATAPPRFVYRSARGTVRRAGGFYKLIWTA